MDCCISRLSMVVFLLIFSISINDCMCSCTEAYNVSLSAEDSICIDISPTPTSLVDHECLTLSDFFRTRDYSNCDLQLFFSSGKYRLTSSNIDIRNSLEMSALDPEVSILCTDGERNSSNNETTIWVNLNKGGIPAGQTTIRGLFFENCTFAVRIDFVENLIIDNCTFRGFKAPGLDIYNCLNVRITDSRFIANNVSTFNDRYRADAAGLSIAYHFERSPFSNHSSSSSNPTLLIKNCEFNNNHAAVSGDLSDQINKAVNDKSYPARGGGLGIIIIQEYANVTVLIEDCLFLENYAKAFGGAIYLNVAGKGANHSLTLLRTKFFCNKSGLGGGAVFIGYVGTNFQGNPSKTEFINVLFDRNSVNSAGVVLVVHTQTRSYVVFRSCNFTSNHAKRVGAAIVFTTMHRSRTRGSLHMSSSIIDNCAFANNTSSGGVMVANTVNIEAHGICLFTANHGPALMVSRALFEVRGNITFLGNMNIGEVAGKAALYITELGRIKMYRNSHLKFINNTGSIGAAIKVELERFPGSYQNLIGNPLCFLQFENTSIPPIEWQKDLIHFSGNTAFLGSAILASFYDFCSYNNVENITEIFKVGNIKQWPIFNFSVNNNTYHEGEDEINQEYYVQTPAVSFINDSSSEKVHLQLGKNRVFNLKGLDQFGSLTYFVVRILDNNNNNLRKKLLNTFKTTESIKSVIEIYSILDNQKDTQILDFNPKILIVKPSKSVTTRYSLKLIHHNSHSGLLYGQEKESGVLLKIQDSFGKEYMTEPFRVCIESCLPGYELKSSRADPNVMECKCVGSQEDPFSVIDCHEEQETIHLRDGYWSGQSLEHPACMHDKFDDPNLAVSICPATYCQCRKDKATESCVAEYNHHHIDKQCHPPRQGPLCGSCGNTKFVTVLRFKCLNISNCQFADSATYYFTVALVFTDSILITLILLISVKFGLGFPHILKSVLFYIQTAYIATEYFPISFWEPRQYMLYLGNLLGLFIPYDFCFLPNTNLVLSFVPRFIPAILVVIITFIFFYFKRARKKIWHGVWTLVLLLYSPLVYTCVMLLKCPRIPDTEGKNNVARWFLNASITCFDNTSHVVLGTFALLFLIGLVLLIPLTLFLIIFENFSFIRNHNQFLKNILKALKSGYRPNRYWVSSMEIAKRLLLVGILIGCPGRSIAPVYVVSFFFFIHLYFLPYKNHLHNTLEAIVLLNYITLLVLSFCQTVLDNLDQSYTGVMVPSDSEEKLPHSPKVKTFFSCFFYAPVFIGLVVCIIWSIRKILKCFGHKLSYSVMSRRNRKQQASVLSDNDHDAVYKHENQIVLNSFGKCIPVTNINFETN